MKLSELIRQLQIINATTEEAYIEKIYLIIKTLKGSNITINFDINDE